MRFGGLGNYTYLCAPFERIDIAYWIGEVVEWSITAVLKTVDVKASGGSNPSLSRRLCPSVFLYSFAKTSPAVRNIVAAFRNFS